MVLRTLPRPPRRAATATVGIVVAVEFPSETLHFQKSFAIFAFRRAKIPNRIPDTMKKVFLFLFSQRMLLCK